MVKTRNKLIIKSLSALIVCTSLVPATMAFATTNAINVLQTTGPGAEVGNESDFYFDSDTGTITGYSGSDTEVTIPKTIDGVSVKRIGDYAFEWENYVTSITLPDGITSIGDGAFYGCYNLNDITIPDTVTSIESYAFYGCNSLTDITIPDTVTTIGSYAFYGCGSLTSITLPDGITSIGEQTFYECSNLTSITIPNTVTSIGSYAFYECSGLTSITIPSSVTNIEYNAFYRCNNAMFTVDNQNIKTLLINSGVNSSKITLNSHIKFNKTTGAITGYDGSEKSVIIPSKINGDSVTSIASNAFKGLNTLTSITIPSSVTSIGSNAFYGCSNAKFYVESKKVNDLLISSGVDKSKIIIVTNPADFKFNEGTGAITGYSGYDTKIVIPNAINGVLVTSIGDNAFSGYKNLTSITIPNSVTTIGYNAFYGCKSLTSIIIPSSVKSIGDSAFNGCKSLTSITIPDSVTSIEYGTFNGCSSLTSITIPKTVTYISDYAFNGCSSLTSVTIPSGVTSIGAYTFGECSDLKSIIIPSSVTSIGYNAFDGCSSLTSITIPANVKSIGANAFSECTGLTSITIPANVTSIDDSAFDGCSNLKNISVDAKNSNYKSINGILFNKAQTKIIKYPEGKQDKSYAIPSGIKIIGDNAFSGCSALTSITIPTSVTNMGESAFEDCSSLKSITIPNSLVSISAGAFKRCSALTSITIPTSVKTIEENAFLGCSSLTSITIPDGVTNIGYNAFAGCNKLTSVKISNSVTSIENNAFGSYYDDEYDESDVPSSKNALFYVKSEKVKKLLIKSGVDTSRIIIDGQVTSVTLNTQKLSLLKGKTGSLTATVAPKTATNKTLKWSSSNTKVAMVDSTGKVTAVGVGTADITCVSTDGSGKSATCKVTVTSLVSVTGVSLKDTSVKVGKTSTLTASVTPTNATNKDVTWKSSDPTVATIDASGKITAKKAGKTTITCTTKDGNKTAKCIVTITK